MAQMLNAIAKEVTGAAANVAGAAANVADVVIPGLNLKENNMDKSRDDDVAKSQNRDQTAEAPAGDEETPKADNNNGPSAYRLESIQSTTLPEDEPASTITSDNMPAIDGSAKDEATPTDGSAADKASLDKAPAEVSAAKPEFTTTKKETTSSGQQAVITQEDTTAEAAASTPQLTAGAQPLPKFRKGKEKWLKSKTLPYPDVFGIQHYPG
eukprot:GHRR01000971.1.p1 GENE.GHRR01000971.1~~GHRR01000971.1.p1  ORF type:complete len:211 (-),score=69.19 GHRR01000971.1:2820-3452(-)